ncbi:MAG: hypothetical protein Q4C47_03580 [Planctomycetia bacterium]|nr:hypothetical protein [Planctomycetia bacterium]
MKCFLRTCAALAALLCWGVAPDDARAGICTRVDASGSSALAELEWRLYPEVSLVSDADVELVSPLIRRGLVVDEAFLDVAVDSTMRGTRETFTRFTPDPTGSVWMECLPAVSFAEWIAELPENFSWWGEGVSDPMEELSVRSSGGFSDALFRVTTSGPVDSFFDRRPK